MTEKEATKIQKNLSGMTIDSPLGAFIFNKMLQKAIKTRFGISSSSYLDYLNIYSDESQTKITLSGSLVVNNDDLKKLIMEGLE